ncbi:hypothetical protein Hanom_Chr10g00964161 [Helianthus anomalus]
MVFGIEKESSLLNSSRVNEGWASLTELQTIGIELGLWIGLFSVVQWVISALEPGRNRVRVW